MRSPEVVLLIALAGFSIGASTAQEPATDPPDPYVGNQMCASCHRDVHTALLSTHHEPSDSRDPAAAGCQSCHGPGRTHVQKPEDSVLFPRIAQLSADRNDRLCQRCHSDATPSSAST